MRGTRWCSDVRFGWSRGLLVQCKSASKPTILCHSIQVKLLKSRVPLCDCYGTNPKANERA